MIDTNFINSINLLLISSIFLTLTLLVSIIVFFFIRKSMQKLALKIHLENNLRLAISEIAINICVSEGFINNESAINNGTYAKYWNKHLYNVDLSLLSKDGIETFKKIPIVQMLDVENQRLLNAEFELVQKNAKLIKRELLNLIPIVNAIIKKYKLKIPFMPNEDKINILLNQGN